MVNNFNCIAWVNVPSLLLSCANNSKFLNNKNALFKGILFYLFDNKIKK